jgi:hypothetical protein
MEQGHTTKLNIFNTKPGLNSLTRLIHINVESYNTIMEQSEVA